MFCGFFVGFFQRLGQPAPVTESPETRDFINPLGLRWELSLKSCCLDMAVGQVPKISSWISVYTPAIKHGSNMDQTRHAGRPSISLFLIFPLPKLHWLRGFQQNHEPRLMTPSVLGHWYPIFIHYLDISWFLKPYIKLLFFHIIHDLNLIYSMIIIHQKRLFSPSHYLPWKKPPFSYGFPMVFPFKTSIFAGISPTESIRNFVVARWLARPRPHRKAHSGTLGGGKNRIICDM